jgi:hypothetical protein
MGSHKKYRSGRPNYYRNTFIQGKIIPIKTGIRYDKIKIGYIMGVIK